MKIKIGLFFGGNSTEHEVSIVSALQALEFFNKSKYDILPIYITKDNKFYISEHTGNISEYKNIKSLIEKSEQVLLVKNGKKVDLVKYPTKMFGNKVYDYIDIAFPIVHGTNVEDGTLQGLFNMLDIPFVGCDVSSSAIGMDKYVMKCVLKENNIPVLDGIVFNKFSYTEDSNEVIINIKKKFDYPVIIKPINLGSSVGIKIAKDDDSLKDALDYAFTFSYKIVVEKAVTKIKEVNCSVLGDIESATASECEQPISSDEILSYKDKYLSSSSSKKTSNASSKTGGTMESLSRKLPADISDEMREKIRTMAVDTFKVLGCNGVARIDFIIDEEDDKVYVNEINTIPGSLSFYLWKAVGMDYTTLLEKMIQLSLKRKREQEDIVFSFETNILDVVSLGGAKGSKN
ncbi:MAG: D-alanine--D-alanine ligase [Peptostreptococcaceae bacterium]|nr:D-alanine--D-alanine ligase [Peptostreptococcaceae bacterium]